MTTDTVIIYGKQSCPFTRAARQSYTEAGRSIRFIDVKTDPKYLEEMLRHSGGDRRIPVILDDGAISIGWGGKA
ncbi:UXX-star selenoprotein family 1 [Desulfatirhabdium butyrativorans]|uniref:UXX-star selenoprotein family 1 n=1 Tax=Desulfatirhabdium butyrativorans TaxID=340467 RepID=UPI000405FBEF|nr:UXX-star (seleno)protein family 1 [Desulfatirhabdium butyrativorans]